MQSLDVLRAAKGVGVYTKSSIMLGLGETDEEVRFNKGNVRDRQNGKLGDCKLGLGETNEEVRACTQRGPLHSAANIFLRKWLQCWCAC